MNYALDSKKIELIQQISTLQNMLILDRISVLIASEVDKESWNEISIEEKKSIDNGLDDASKGKLISHTKVKSTYAKWL